MERLMGMLLVMLAVQMLLNGVKVFLGPRTSTAFTPGA
jgi:small neutral amino acid transporter SnatA (MarC family)